MADILEKNKRYLDPNGGGEDGGGSGDPYLDEIHRAVSEKNYKALLQGDIAAYNFHANTRKYLDDTLAQQGFGTQGYGSSAHVGAANQAQTLYAQNLEAYNAGEQEALLAAEDRRKAESTESDNQLVTYLQYSNGSDDSIAGYMSQYGYVQGGDGNWYRKKADGTADLTQPASPYVQAAVQSARENDSVSPSYGVSQEAAKSNAAAFLAAYKTDGIGYTIESLMEQEVNANDNRDRRKLNDVVPNEIEYMKKNAQYYQDGTLIKLQRGNGAHDAYLILYLNGKFYIVSNDDNEMEGGQVYTRYNEYNGPKVEIKGK